MSQRLRVFVTVAAGCAAALLSATQSLAVPAVPHGETSVTDYPAGELCAFPVRIEVVATTATTAPRPTPTDNKLIFTGPIRATITNISTDVSRTYNISGPTFVDTTTNPPGIVLTGPALILQPASLNIGAPFLKISSGRVSFPANNPIETQHGKFTHDVCAELT
jgi:hypothetical protein